MKLAWVGVVAIVGCTTTRASSEPIKAPDASTCRPIDGTEPAIAFKGAPLPLVCKGIYVDPALTAAEREQVKVWYGSSFRAIRSVFGDAVTSPPVLVQCLSKECIAQFSPEGGRSHAVIDPPTVYLNGVGPMTPGTITHEMVHVVIGTKAKKSTGGRVPTWFDEGVATFLGDNVECAPGMALAIDDLRRLRHNAHWSGYTALPGRIRLSYCQARDEISAWVAIAAVATMLAGIAVDRTGRSHPAHVDAKWTMGRKGFGVDVSGGRDVRLDGLLDFSLPDMPFTISLWTKPRAGSRVLVHSAIDVESAKGFCLPVLGHDESGKLVAQVNYGSTPDTFLVAKSAALPVDQWSHLAMTWSPKGGVSIYVNGSLAAHTPPTNAAQEQRDVPATDMRLFFGGERAGHCWRGALPKGNWDGVLDEIRVHSYALSASEIAELAR